MKRISVLIAAMALIFGIALQDAYAGKVSKKLPVIRVDGTKRVQRQAPPLRVSSYNSRKDGKTYPPIDGKADGKEGKGDGKSDGKPEPTPPAPFEGNCRGKEKKGLASLWPEDQKICGDTSWLFPGLIWGECGLRICIVKGPKRQGAFGPTEF